MANSIPTKTSFKKGHIRSLDSRLKQSKTMQGRINPLAIIMMNTPESNKKKGLIGKLSPNWIEDRTMIKHERSKTEEKNFFKEVLKERNFKCELTGEGGTMSVHHIKPVWKYPNLRFNKEFVIVVKLSIHKLFHSIYGLKANENDWNNFITNKQYAFS